MIGGFKERRSKTNNHEFSLRDTLLLQEPHDGTVSLRQFFSAPAVQTGPARPGGLRRLNRSPPRRKNTRTSSGSCEVEDDDEGELQPEFRQLRRAIRLDVQEVLHAELAMFYKADNGPFDDFFHSEGDDSSVEVDSGPEEQSELLPPSSQAPDAAAINSPRSAAGSTERRKALEDVKGLSGLKEVKEVSKKYALEESSSRMVQRLRQQLNLERDWQRRPLDFLEWLLLLKEPKREDCLANFESHKCFEGFFTFVIVMNAIFMISEVNASITDDSDMLTDVTTVDKIFLGLYSFELTIKLCVHRLFFFWNSDMGWNILDFMLVLYSFSEIVLKEVCGSIGGGQTTWFRFVRMFRIAKALRIFRVVKAFKELQLILNCILGSLQSMLWSVVMLAIMYYMFSMLLVQQLGLYLRGTANNDEGRELLLEHFGSVQTCMWTLFTTTFGGEDWVLYYSDIDRLGWMARFLWFLFIIFTQVALLNILTGIFVESALELVEGSAQEKAIKHEEHLQEDAAELRKLCEQCCDSKNVLSKAEFEKLFQSDDFTRYLNFIGLDMTHIQMFRDLMVEKDDEDIDITAFVAGCMQLRGFAKTSDLIAMMFEVKNLQHMQLYSARELRAHFVGLRAMLEPGSSLERRGSRMSFSSSRKRSMRPEASQ